MTSETILENLDQAMKISRVELTVMHTEKAKGLLACLSTQNNETTNKSSESLGQCFGFVSLGFCTKALPPMICYHVWIHHLGNSLGFGYSQNDALIPTKNVC